MFSKVITESDAFLEMPLSTQALYFHLGMQGDDDGFINSYKKVMRMIGANQNDYDLLIAKNFVVEFENGIILMKHWLMHNYIRKDRYKETVYTKEKALLFLKENKAYTLDNSQGLPLGIPMVDVDKISIDKSSLNKISLNQDNVFVVFQKEIGQATPMMYEGLKGWLEEFTEDIIILAIQKASLGGVRTYKYIDGILKNWLTLNVKVLADVNKLDEEFEAKKSKSKTKTDKFTNYEQRQGVDYEALANKAMQKRVNGNS